MTNKQLFADFNNTINSENIVVCYFSHEKCNVCKVLLPKVKKLVEQDFPNAKILFSNIEQCIELAAQNNVFTAPAIIIFVQGKEYMRWGKNIGLTELAQSISRPYKMIFED